MSASLEDANNVLHEMLNRSVQTWLEELAGTFDEDPYYRRAKYETVPLSDKKIVKLKEAEDLLYKHGARLEEGPSYTRTKKTWLETKEEWQNRLATLPPDRVDWIKQQLAEGKVPPKSAFFYDDDVRKAMFGDRPIEFRINGHRIG